jgi:hypothetical protein
MNGGLAPIIVVGAGAVAAWMAGRSVDERLCQGDCNDARAGTDRRQSSVRK